MKLTLSIPGDPVAKGRARAVVFNDKPQIYTPAKTRNFENLVKLAAQVQMVGRKPFEVPIIVTARFFVSIPRSWPMKKQARARSGEILPQSRPDLDNLAKAITDGMNKLVFRDDSLICDLILSKRYDLVPRAEITVESYEEEETRAPVARDRPPTPAARDHGEETLRNLPLFELDPPF